MYQTVPDLFVWCHLQFYASLGRQYLSFKEIVYHCFLSKKDYRFLPGRIPEQSLEMKVFWTMPCCSWWRVSLVSSFIRWSSNSPIILVISGPASIHQRSAPGFYVKPTAPPSPLTYALFCSCVWSIVMAEKNLWLFWTVNLPALNLFAIFGCFDSRSVKSCIWTGKLVFTKLIWLVPLHLFGDGVKELIKCNNRNLAVV